MPTVQEMDAAVSMTYTYSEVLTVPQIMLLMQSVKSSIEAGCLKTASAEYIKQIGSDVCQTWGKIIGDIEEMTAIRQEEQEPQQYEEQPEQQTEQTQQPEQTEQQETHQQLDNWVQCDKCDTWHKVETLEGLREEFFCNNLGKACRAPKEAEKFWVASCAKRLARYYKAWDGQPYTGINHYAALEFLAARKGITIAELCNISPYDYMGPSSKRHFRFPVRNAPTLRVLPMPYRRY
jgi:hypothetical protein